MASSALSFPPPQHALMDCFDEVQAANEKSPPSSVWGIVLVEVFHQGSNAGTRKWNSLLRLFVVSFSARWMVVRYARDSIYK